MLAAAICLVLHRLVALAACAERSARILLCHSVFIRHWRSCLLHELALRGFGRARFVVGRVARHEVLGGDSPQGGLIRADSVALASKLWPGELLIAAERPLCSVAPRFRISKRPIGVHPSLSLFEQRLRSSELPFVFFGLG